MVTSYNFFIKRNFSLKKLNFKILMKMLRKKDLKSFFFSVNLFIDFAGFFAKNLNILAFIYKIETYRGHPLPISFCRMKNEKRGLKMNNVYSSKI